MSSPKIRVLHVEDNAGDARLMQEYLRESGNVTFDVTLVRRVCEAVETLERGSVDIVLLDLSLPDAHGLDTVRRIASSKPDVPIVVLTGLDDDALGFRAVQAGAQDYLVKNRMDEVHFGRALRYAIERHRTRAELVSLALVDEMTGLYNRRGFQALAEQQVRLAHRQHCGLVLVFCDVDDLKEINDTFGHSEGDRAIMTTARLMRETLRDTDLVARMGGDEFTILALDSSGSGAGNIVSRLKERLDAYNRGADRPYALSLSMGVAHRDLRNPVPMSDLLAEADRALYEQKRARKRARAAWAGAGSVGQARTS